MKRVFVPIKMWEAVEKIARENPTLGYTSGNEIIRDVLRQYLRQYTIFQRLCETEEDDDDTGGPLNLQPPEGYA